MSWYKKKSIQRTKPKDELRFFIGKERDKKTREGKTENLVNVKNGLSCDALEVNLHSEMAQINRKKKRITSSTIIFRRFR